jgi:hypothetical protein
MCCDCCYWKGQVEGIVGNAMWYQNSDRILKLIEKASQNSLLFYSSLLYCYTRKWVMWEVKAVPQHEATFVYVPFICHHWPIIGSLLYHHTTFSHRPHILHYLHQSETLILSSFCHINCTPSHITFNENNHCAGSSYGQKFTNCHSKCDWDVNIHRSICGSATLNSEPT